MTSRGTHIPARNSSGNSTADPIPGATLPFGATAAITSPMAINAAVPSRKTGTNQTHSRGADEPKISEPATISRTTLTTATARLMSNCTPSSRPGCTGVVDILLSTPWSR